MNEVSIKIDLSEAAPSASYTSHWIDADGSCWELPTHCVVIGRSLVLWTHTEEAGVSDVTSVDFDVDDDLEAVVREYAEEIAADLGTLADVSSGEHYTVHGIQYQPPRYDQDGYRIIVTPRSE